MKLLKLFLILQFNVVIGQTVIDPEFAGRPYIMNKDSSLSSLERVDAKLDSKTKGMGYGGLEIYYSVFSSKSETRFKVNEIPKIVIKIEAGKDPSEEITLVVAEVKKEKRRFIQSDEAMGGRAKNIAQSFIKLEFKKIKNGIYEIIVPQNLAIGEYGFLPYYKGPSGVDLIISGSGQSAKISCFGID